MPGPTITTYLITGANQGLGFGAVKLLAKDTPNLLIFLGSRSLEAGQAAVKSFSIHPGSEVVPVQLDVTKDDSIAKAVETVKTALSERHLPPVLNALVNNAGIALDGSHEPGRELLRKTFDVNVFGVYVMTEAFLPLLRGAEHPLVLNISSGLGSITNKVDPTSPYYNTNLVAYNPSKAALNMLTVNHSLLHKDVRFVTFCPGFNATKLNGYSPRARDSALGSKAIVDALLDPSIPSGSYVNENGKLPW